MQQEQQLYKLPKKAARVFIPKILSLILLSALFYGGILLNISLLSLKRSAESQAKTIAILIVAILMLLGLITNIVRAKTSTTFFQSKIALSKHKKIAYTTFNIQEIQATQNSMDKLFKTYHIKLSKNHAIEAIPATIDPSQVTNYLNQLITYAKQNQMQNNSYQQQNQYQQQSYQNQRY